MQLFVMIVISVIFMRLIIIIMVLMWSEKQKSFAKNVDIFNRKREQNVCMCKNIMSGDL